MTIISAASVENKENEKATAAVEDDEFKIDIDALVADVNKEELMSDVLAEKPDASTDSSECCVLVDGIPIVTVGEKFDKLRRVIAKEYERIQKDAYAHYPLDDDGTKTKGYCFIEFDTREDALACVAGLNGHRLDKKHTFTVCQLSKLMSSRMPEQEWTQPQPQPYKQPGNLWWWLEKEQCVDQYALLYNDGKELAIYNNNLPRDPDIVCDNARRQDWTEQAFVWSPRGAYLATFHRQGIALWGGEEFHQIRKFPHPNVVSIDFSPCESYLVTYSAPQTKHIDYISVENSLCVWDVRSGDRLRGLAVGGTTGLRVNDWPFLKWSHDSKYLACRREADRVGTGIGVYELPSCALLDKKTIPVTGVCDVQWSPRDNFLAYWTAEGDGRPARVAIMSIPDKRDIGTKNPFNVVEATLFWQPSGDRLAVQMQRYAKKKQIKDKNSETDIKYTGITYHLDVFHLREKDVPVDTMELRIPADVKSEALGKEATPQAFCWEPTGDKFALLLGSDRISVPVFYSAKSTDKMVELKALDPVQGLNTLLWSPQGQWMIVASIRRPNTTGSGHIIFVDASQGSDIIRVNATDKNTEHTQCTQAMFDPTGRYLMTALTSWDSGGRATDYGYRVYSSQGRLLRKVAIDKLAMVAWRPRPPCCLDDAKLKELKRQMKTLAEKFAAADEKEAGRASLEVMDNRRKLMAEWLAKKEESAAMEADEERLELRGKCSRNTLARTKTGGLDTDDHDGEEMEEETIEFIIETIRTEVENSRKEVEVAKD